MLSYQLRPSQFPDMNLRKVSALLSHQHMYHVNLQKSALGSSIVIYGIALFIQYCLLSSNSRTTS
jgi:hypothetical protein